MYKIICQKANNINISLEIVKSIKKHCNMTAVSALGLARALEDSFEFESRDLFVAISPFYEIEVIEPDPWESDSWGRPGIPEYSEEEKSEAFAWLEKLSEQEKKWIEIIRTENPVYLAPIG